MLWHKFVGYFLFVSVLLALVVLRETTNPRTTFIVVGHQMNIDETVGLWLIHDNIEYEILHDVTITVERKLSDGLAEIFLPDSVQRVEAGNRKTYSAIPIIPLPPGMWCMDTTYSWTPKYSLISHKKTEGSVCTTVK